MTPAPPRSATRVVLGSKIARERAELGNVKGTLAVQGAGPALSPEPAPTKKHGAKATLSKDVIAFVRSQADEELRPRPPERIGV